MIEETKSFVSLTNNQEHGLQLPYWNLEIYYKRINVPTQLKCKTEISVVRD